MFRIEIKSLFYNSEQNHLFVSICAVMTNFDAFNNLKALGFFCRKSGVLVEFSVIIFLRERRRKEFWPSIHNCRLQNGRSGTRELPFISAIHILCIWQRKFNIGPNIF